MKSYVVYLQGLYNAMLSSIRSLIPLSDVIAIGIRLACSHSSNREVYHSLWWTSLPWESTLISACPWDS